MLEKDDIEDYEAVPIFQKFKVEQLRQRIRDMVDLKYKISLYKGMQIFLESVIQFLLMLSIVIKANVYSLIYLIFIYRFIRIRTRTELLIKINFYMALFFVVQYVLYLINLTASTSPANFPPGFYGYPQKYEDNMYAIPVMFHYKPFWDLRICYLLGIGVDKDQVRDLIIDFVNLFIVSMYCMIYRNPILLKKMNKVFWQFPTPQNKEQWKRLNPEVQKQVKFLYNYKPISDYKGCTFDKRQVATANENLEFAEDYAKQSKIDLNYLLVTYVDL
jgi:hypothetical protein